MTPLHGCVEQIRTVLGESLQRNNDLQTNYLAGTSKLANHVLGTHALHTAAVRVRQMLSINAIPVSSITNTIAKSTHIQRLGHPLSRDSTEKSRKAIDVLGRGAAVGIDVAGKATAVLWVADEEDALDGGHGGAGELGHGVYGCGGALRVALENEAHVGVGGERVGDLSDNL
jgi:hypothetical protein